MIFNKLGMSLLAGATFLLGGCALTRVSASRHESEVKGLHLEGLTRVEAIAKAEKAGFTCATYDSGPYPSPRFGMQMVINQSCEKVSAELICPQRRYVNFAYLVTDGKVLTAWPSITEKACF